jgi:FAD synthetase
MVRVMASGVFDLIHLGHINYLMQARELGDELYVVVATDNTVRKIKHEPITNEDIRLQIVRSLKPVDDALLGYDDEDRYKIVEEIKPDVIAIGYDQAHNEEKIIEELKERGLDIKVVRLKKFDDDLNGTRKIIRKIIDLWSFTKKMEEIEGK